MEEIANKSWSWLSSLQYNLIFGFKVLHTASDKFRVPYKAQNFF
jgi:hypothetical protein